MRTVLAKRKKHTAGDISFSIINYTIFFLITLICVYPFYYLIINTISNNQLSANGVIMWYPREIHFDNYVKVFQLKSLPQAFLISILRTVIGTCCSVFACAYLGFMFTQTKMWKHKFWYRFMVITMYFNAGLIPIFIIIYNLHLTNTFLVYILPGIVQPFNIILVKTYIESTPKSLQEAAEIDGAGILRIFISVIFPIITPIVATITIFTAVGNWNAFQDTLLYITDTRLYTLQYLLYTYINQANSVATMIQNTPGLSGEAIANLATKQTPTSIQMTVSVIVMIPILMVYPFFQKHFVQGIMIGAIKG